MEAAVGQNMQFPKWINQEKLTRMPSASLQCKQICRKEKSSQFLVPRDSRVKKGLTSSRRIVMEVSYSYNKSSASVRDSGSHFASLDEGLVLKNKAQEIMPYLDGRSIYLVGMMGSGKTTVGKILSEVLEYSFCDSDLLVEGNVGGMSVAEIFKLYGEGYFREKESEALRYLSLMHRLVVSTGGGAVTRPINWNYMHKGISVYINVPLETLAQRIAAVGTASRPLLHQESGDAYTKAFMRLSTLLEEREDAYANASTTVSLESIAAKLGHRDVSNLTPTIIAIEALQQIEDNLKDEGNLAF